MAHLSFHAAATLSQPLTESTLVRVGELLRSAVRGHWALRRQRPQPRAGRVPDRLTDMNLHMLRDVGAPDWLIDRAADQRQRQQAVERLLGRPPMY